MVLEIRADEVAVRPPLSQAVGYVVVVVVGLVIAFGKSEDVIFIGIRLTANSDGIGNKVIKAYCRRG